MRVEVNADLCQGHNRCYALAPELFDVDDYGTAVVIGDGSVDAELEDEARLAVANCPDPRSPSPKTHDPVTIVEAPKTSGEPSNRLFATA